MSGTSDPETFGSTAHGAGRLTSRTRAKRDYGAATCRTIREREHIQVGASPGATIAEEAPGVYGGVDEVVRVSDALGIGGRVARTFPVCIIKRWPGSGVEAVRRAVLWLPGS